MPKASAKRKAAEKKKPPQASARGVSAGNEPVKRRGPPPKSEGGRTPFILRFENDVYEAIKDLAEQAGVSVNQFMDGLSRWAVRNVRIGEPVINEAGEVVGERSERGCVWAGEIASQGDETKAEKPKGVWMSLDFTGRRVVR